MATETREAWLSAEVERSAVEAAHTGSLQISDAVFERYEMPFIDTAYPLEYVFAHTVHDAPGDAIDLGCGSGLNSVLLAAQGWDVLGLDVSPDLVRLAQSRYRLHDAQCAGEVTCEVGDAHALPNVKVDLVMGIAILHHLDLQVAVAEIARVLRPGGHAIFQEPIRDSGLMRLFRRLVPRRGDDVSPFEAPLTTRQLLEAFSRAHGFDLVVHRPFRSPLVKLLKPFGSKAERLAYKLDRFVFAVPLLERFATVRVLVARRREES